MKVRLGKSIDIDKAMRNDLIAFAGQVNCYKRGMTFRQVLTALADHSGMEFLDQCRNWLSTIGAAPVLPISRRSTVPVEEVKRPAQHKTEPAKKIC